MRCWTRWSTVSSTRAFARDDDDRPVAVTDEQRAAILHAASRAPSAGAMMMYSIVSIREQATLDRPADLCDHQPMIAKAPRHQYLWSICQVDRSV